MKITIALFIILFLAFGGYHLTFKNFKLPLFARQFYLTGTEFLFVGLALGPLFLNLLNEDIQKGLAPLSALLLGWIGLLFGFQFEIRKLRRFPAEYLLAGILEGLATVVLVFLAVYFTVPAIGEISNTMQTIAALTLAAAAACTAQTALALMVPTCVERCRNLLRLLRYVSSIDGLGALLIFGLAFVFRPSASSDASWGGAAWHVVLISLGASMGLLLLFTILLNQRRHEGELTLVVIGMIVLTSGMASTLKFSPLLTNFFVGLWLANLCRDKERVYQILVTVEKPMYLLLLILLGVTLQFESVWVILWAAVYCTYRFMAKFLAGKLVTGLARSIRSPRHCLGSGLLDQGGLPLAILLDFQQSFPCRTATLVTTLAVLAVIYNEFLSPYFLRRLLNTD